MFEQYAFARAAFADDGGHLSLKNSQADAPEHLVGAEFFDDIVKLDQGSLHLLLYFCSFSAANATDRGNIMNGNATVLRKGNIGSS